MSLETGSTIPLNYTEKSCTEKSFKKIVMKKKKKNKSSIGRPQLNFNL